MTQEFNFLQGRSRGGRMDDLDHIKVKPSYSERHNLEQEKMFAKDTPNKGLLFKTYKDI